MRSIPRLLDNVLREMSKTPSRRLDQTTVLAKLANKKDAVYVCHNSESDFRINKEYDVSTMCLESFYRNPGMAKVPFIFDHMTLQCVISLALQEIEKLERENEKLHEKINKITSILEDGDE